MRITCGVCKAVYNIDDSLVSAAGVKAQCPACGDIQVVRAGASGAADDPFADLSAPPPPIPPASPPASADPFADLSSPLGGGQPAQDLGFSGNDDPFGAITQPRPGDDDPFASLSSGAAYPGASNEAFSTQPSISGQGSDFSPFAREEKSDIPNLGMPDAPAAGEDSDLMSRRVSSRHAPEAKSQAAPSRRCARCGRGLDEGGGADGLCQSCFQMLGPKEVSYDDDREWRVQKPEGTILGPLTLNEVKEKFKSKEVEASDRVARRDGEFRLISSYPEFAVFFRRPGESLQPAFRAVSQSHVLRNTILVLILLLGAAAAVFYLKFWPVEAENPSDTIIEEALDSFAAEIPNPTGDPHKLVKRAVKLMQRDERIGYMEADRLFKTAILIDPSNIDAIGGWVQNRALLDVGSSDVNRRKMALDLIDFALERTPDLPSLQRAKAYLLESLGNHQEAQLIAGKVYTMMPEDTETQLVLGMTYLDTNTEKASELFTKAMEGNTDLNLAYRMSGEANIRLGRFHDALAFFQRRLERDPGQFQSLKAVARVYTAVGDFRMAAKVYETILGAEPDRAEAAISLARLKSQFFDEAKQAASLLASFEKSNQDLPAAQMAQVMAERAACLRLRGNKKKALEVVDQALQKDPMLVNALYLKAVLEFENGNLAQAISRLREMRSHLPGEPRVLAWLAIAEGQVPNYDSALRNLLRAIELGSHDLDLYLLMGAINLDLDNVNRAYTWLRKATDISPFYARQHLAPREFFDGSGFLADAVERVNRALVKHSEDAMALTLAGLVLWRGGRQADAKLRLTQALAIDPENVAANLYMGAMLLDRDQLPKAAKFLETAHKGDALQPVAARLLAEVWTRMNKAKKAERLLNGVIKADPGDLEARLLLAEVWLAKKKTRKRGMALLQKVYEGDNDNMRAKRLLFKLKT